jgi:hypothetical protein
MSYEQQESQKSERKVLDEKALDELARRGEQPTLKPQTLSGQQMQTLAARYNTQLQEIYRDIKLRELALDKAVEFSKSPLAQVPDVMKLARDVHAFLVEAAASETT